MSNNYTSLDYQDVMDSLGLFMKSQEEFKDFNFDGSAIRELLRVLAYNAQQQGFENNFIYNELQHDSAQLRQNLSSLASRLGYTPSSKRAARIKVNLIVTPSDANSAPSVLTLDRNASFYSTNEGAAYSFSPDKEYSTPLVDGKYSFENVTLLQGTWAINAFMVQSNGVESYVIPNLNMDSDTLEVFVRTSETSGDQTPYSRFTTAYDLGMESKIFFVRENRNGFYEIKFGDNKFAKKLDYGNVVTTRYLVTQGEAGNNLGAISPSTTIGGYFNIQVSKIDERSYGGAEEESIESIRTLSTLGFVESGNAVNPGDYVSITKKTFSEAGDIISWGGEDNTPPKYGYVFVSVKPKNSETLSSSQKAELVEILKKYNVGSITPIIADPEYLYINARTKIKFNPKLITISTNALKTKVSDYFKKFSKLNIEKFNGSLDMSTLSEFVNKEIDKSIVGNFTEISYEKRFVPEINFNGAYSFSIKHGIKAGTVKVENFRVSDPNHLDAVHFIEDVDSVLVLKRLDGGETTVLNDNVGSVDYSTGYINLTLFRPNMIVGDYVTIKCEPSYGDSSTYSNNNSILVINEVKVDLEIGA